MNQKRSRRDTSAEEGRVPGSAANRSHAAGLEAQVLLRLTTDAPGVLARFGLDADAVGSELLQLALGTTVERISETCDREDGDSEVVGLLARREFVQVIAVALEHQVDEAMADAEAASKSLAMDIADTAFRPQGGWRWADPLYFDASFTEQETGAAKDGSVGRWMPALLLSRAACILHHQTRGLIEDGRLVEFARMVLAVRDGGRSRGKSAGLNPQSEPRAPRNTRRI